MPKSIKATNGKNKKSTENHNIITDDTISWCNENAQRQKYEQEQKRKQAQKKAKREAERKKRSKKETAIFIWLSILTLFIIAQIINIAMPIPKNDYLNMNTVTDYTVTDEGLMLHTEDGNGYFFEN